MYQYKDDCYINLRYDYLISAREAGFPYATVDGL
jgi:hypothetical protein